MHFTVNWLAVLIGAVAGMAIGAGWYTTLGKQWMSALGKGETEFKPNDWTPFAWGFATQLVTAYFVALITPALFGEVTVWSGILAGAHMWFGFVLTTLILNHRYQNMPWKLTLIDGGYLLIVLVVQGIIVGLFGGGAPAA